MKLILITGVFDVLHQEHLAFLQKAKKFTKEISQQEKQNFKLWVGLESDKRVKELKGQTRPINNQEKRQKNLQKLDFIDRVFILPTNFNQPKERGKFIAKLKPSFFLVSSHTPFIKQKKHIIEKYGGELKIIHQHNPQISTTRILQEN